MSKSFEIEYRNYICADLPDLWDRIEAKLDEQEAAKKTNVTEFTKTEQAVKPAHKKTKIRWQYFGAAAAAAVCLLVAIPVIRNMQGAQTTAPQGAGYEGSGDATEAVNSLGTAPTAGSLSDHVYDETEGGYLYGHNAYWGNNNKNSEVAGSQTSVQYQIITDNSMSVWINNADGSGVKVPNGSTTYKDTYARVWAAGNPGSYYASESAGQVGVLGMSIAQPATDTAMEQNVTFVVAVLDDTDKEEMDQIMKDLSLYTDPEISYKLETATGDDINYGQYTLTMSGNMTRSQLSDVEQSVCEIIGKHDFVTMIYRKDRTAAQVIVVK